MRGRERGRKKGREIKRDRRESERERKKGGGEEEREGDTGRKQMETKMQESGESQLLGAWPLLALPILRHSLAYHRRGCHSSTRAYDLHANCYTI